LEIVVNTRLLIKNKLDGIGWFSYETLKRICLAHPEHHFTFLFDRQPDDSLIFSENVTPVVLSPKARHPILFWWWFEYAVAPLLHKLKPDLFLSPDGYLPLHPGCKTLAVIHDLNFAHYPKDLPFSVRLYYNFFFPRFAKNATHIATVSRFSKQDIMQTYGIADSKIDIVYNGADEGYRPAEPEELVHVRKKYTEGSPYFLFVGSLHPRKNIVRLLQAFDLFRKTHTGPFKLLIVGNRYWWTKAEEAALQGMQFKTDVVFTGRMAQEELYTVMASAFALTYIPYFEGFGIPLLEAMQCGIPILTSNTSSLPEVADGAALLVDPFSVPDIANAMKQLAGDESLRNKLIAEGNRRRNDFSWDKTADLLWEAVLHTLRT
jgi:glycosyltransferase involved in cell wall biosynthesis